jgi:hypothetical protein
MSAGNTTTSRINYSKSSKWAWGVPYAKVFMPENNETRSRAEALTGGIEGGGNVPDRGRILERVNAGEMGGHRERWGQDVYLVFGV